MKDRKKMLIAKVHIAKSQLLHDDDEIYREWIRDISKGRTESSKDLEVWELEKLIRRFKAYGWRDSKEQQRLVLYKKMEEFAKRIWGDEWIPVCEKIFWGRFGTKKVEFATIKQLKQMVAILAEIEKRKKKKNREFKVVK